MTTQSRTAATTEAKERHNARRNGVAAARTVTADAPAAQGIIVANLSVDLPVFDLVKDWADTNVQNQQSGQKMVRALFSELEYKHWTYEGENRETHVKEVRTGAAIDFVPRDLRNWSKLNGNTAWPSVFVGVAGERDKDGKIRELRLPYLSSLTPTSTTAQATESGEAAAQSPIEAQAATQTQTGNAQRRTAIQNLNLYGAPKELTTKRVRGALYGAMGIAALAYLRSARELMGIPASAAGGDTSAEVDAFLTALGVEL